jgi:hypothetical protein
VESVTFGTEFGTAIKIFIAASAIIAPVIILLFYLGAIPLEIFTVVAITCIVLSIVIVHGYSIRYVFGNDELIIKYYLAFNEPPVKYSAVRKIGVRTEYAYVLGYSARGVAIYYTDRKYVTISPKNREEFVRMLKERCPQAVIERETYKRSRSS